MKSFLDDSFGMSHGNFAIFILISQIESVAIVDINWLTTKSLGKKTFLSVLVYVSVFTMFLHSLAKNFMENRRDGEKNTSAKNTKSDCFRCDLFVFTVLAFNHLAILLVN